MTQELDAIIAALLAIVLVFFAIIFLAALIIKIDGFCHELDYINQEIRRTTGGEQEYWKRERRRLWLSLLPFYRG